MHILSDRNCCPGFWPDTKHKGRPWRQPDHINRIYIFRYQRFQFWWYDICPLLHICYRSALSGQRLEGTVADPFQYCLHTLSQSVLHPVYHSAFNTSIADHHTGCRHTADRYWCSFDSIHEDNTESWWWYRQCHRIIHIPSILWNRDWYCNCGTSNRTGHTHLQSAHKT